jgi:hypothetical protein
MKNRKKVEDKIYNTLKLLEPSGINADKYKSLFSKMSDKEFINYFKDMKSNEDFNFYVEIDPYGKNNINMKEVEATAKYLNLELEEYIYYRHKTKDGSTIRTPFKVPVIIIHMKRLQHILSKKNKYNMNVMGAGTRSKLTGSLNSTSKSGRLSDYDTLALTSALDTGDGSDILKELLGSRADNLKSKMEMSSQIALFGHAQQQLFTTAKIPESQSINTVDVFFVGAGLKTDLITEGDYLKQGLKIRQDSSKK